MNNNIYVVTGSTSGIGKELLTELSKENIVFASYRNSDYLPELENLGTNVIPFYMDMTDSESISNAVNFIKSNLDINEKIATLFNIAGCVVAGAVEELEIENLKQQFNVNTFSHIEFTQKLLKLNLLEKSKIINVSSMASFGIFPFIAPYCASKRALDILFNSLQLEYGNNLKIVSLKLGAIATPLWEKSIKNNINCLKNSEKYKLEYEFLVNNARKNSTQGLSTKKVVDKILKINSLKNPKSSYTFGVDAKFSEIISKLPQDLINNLVKLGLKYRLKKQPTKNVLNT